MDRFVRGAFDIDAADEQMACNRGDAPEAGAGAAVRILAASHEKGSASAVPSAGRGIKPG
jgi:hypothetical protein